VLLPIKDLDLRLVLGGNGDSAGECLAVRGDFHALGVEVLVFDLIGELNGVVVDLVGRCGVAFGSIAAGNGVVFAVELQGLLHVEGGEGDEDAVVSVDSLMELGLGGELGC
jgi:hypothetical protein